MNGTGSEDGLAGCRLFEHGQRPVTICDVGGVLRLPPTGPNDPSRRDRSRNMVSPSRMRRAHRWTKSRITGPAVDFAQSTRPARPPAPAGIRRDRTRTPTGTHEQSLGTPPQRYSAMVTKSTILRATIATGPQGGHATAAAYTP